jgi:hypothetical protein
MSKHPDKSTTHVNFNGAIPFPKKNILRLPKHASATTECTLRSSRQTACMDGIKEWATIEISFSRRWEEEPNQGSPFNNDSLAAKMTAADIPRTRLMVTQM